MGWIRHDANRRCERNRQIRHTVGVTATDLGARLNHGVDWLFRDRSSGRIVIMQWPNPPILVFLAARVLGWALGPDASVSRFLQWLGTAALLWWSTAEVGWGVNPFRRMLGAVVLALVVLGVIRTLVT